jgi:hypothetical protein
MQKIFKVYKSPTLKVLNNKKKENLVALSLYREEEAFDGNQLSSGLEALCYTRRASETDLRCSKRVKSQWCNPSY